MEVFSQPDEEADFELFEEDQIPQSEASVRSLSLIGVVEVAERKTNQKPPLFCIHPVATLILVYSNMQP